MADEYRHCLVNGENALFHRWTEVREIVVPSPMVGGHSGGEIQQLFAVVEMGDGSVQMIPPERIKFIPAQKDMSPKPPQTRRPPVKKQLNGQRSLKQMIIDGDPEIWMSGDIRDIDVAISIFDKEHMYEYAGQHDNNGRMGYLFRRKK